MSRLELVSDLIDSLRIPGKVRLDKMLFISFTVQRSLVSLRYIALLFTSPQYHGRTHHSNLIVRTDKRAVYQVDRGPGIRSESCSDQKTF